MLNGTTRLMCRNAMTAEQIEEMNMDNMVVCNAGYTRKELKVAFDKVANEENWKMPIKKTLTEEDLQEKAITRKIHEAIIYFTGSIPTFDLYADKGEIVVRAKGYYSAIGA